MSVEYVDTDDISSYETKEKFLEDLDEGITFQAYKMNLAGAQVHLVKLGGKCYEFGTEREADEAINQYEQNQGDEEELTESD